MACFDTVDLIDFIRYEFASEDQTGICWKILSRTSRKARPGGLPLDFRGVDEGLTDDNYPPTIQIVFDNIVSSAIINSRNQLRMTEIDCVESEKEDSERSKIKFASKSETPVIEVIEPLITPPQIAQSIKKNEYYSPESLSSVPEFADFARYESFDLKIGRSFKVFFPFSNDPTTPIEVHSVLDAHVWCLVGLCCYKYARQKRIPKLLESSLNYELRMAEEDGEYEQDLPALDGHYVVGEIGQCWNTVALLVKTCFKTIDIAVYTTNGKMYKYALSTLHHSLRWLLERTIERRLEQEGELFADFHHPFIEYKLEALETPDVALNLDVTIGSTGSEQFLILRKYSVRGDFFIPSKFEKSNTSSETTISTLTRGLANSITSNSQQYSQSHESFAESFDSVSSFDKVAHRTSDTFDIGKKISDQVYNVERLHRYKPSWPAYLYLREDNLEFVPCCTEKKRLNVLSSANSSYMKRFVLSWNQVGGAYLADKFSSVKKILRIVWLQMANFNQSMMDTNNLIPVFEEAIKSNNTEWQTLFKKYECCRWKILHLEVDAMDAVDAAMKVNDELDKRSHEVRKLYNNSLNGVKKPLSIIQEMAYSHGMTPSTSRGPIFSRISSKFMGLMKF